MMVAVLGAGPAGLLTAHAVEQAGFQPVIYSIAEKSKLPGAQFLHTPIPGLTLDPDLNIEFLKRGTREGYAQKVYGAPDASCSWDDFPEGSQSAWSLSSVYDRLWERYSPTVVEGAITGRLLDGIERRYELAFSTVPTPVLCENPQHRFDSVDVWFRSFHATGGTHFIEYNGQPTKGYYRMSRIGNSATLEFGHPVRGAFAGRKPLNTDCDCRHHFHRLGRFGSWRKGVLVHHAYEGARAILEGGN